jgi:hypothetical protein
MRSADAVELNGEHRIAYHGAAAKEGNAVQKRTAILGSALFFVIAPCVVAGVVPWWITRWQFRAPFLGVEMTRAIA